MSILDILVPPIPGTNHMGNGDNDTTKDDPTEDDPITNQDLPIILREEPILNPQDAIALQHDIAHDWNRDNPWGRVQADLQFSIDAIIVTNAVTIAIRNEIVSRTADYDPVGPAVVTYPNGDTFTIPSQGGPVPTEGLVLFGVAAASYSTAQGVSSAVGSAVDTVGSWVGNAWNNFTSAVSNAWNNLTAGGRVDEDPDSPKKKETGEQTEKPVVLDLDNDGLELVSVMESKAQFDLDKDGVPEKLGWISGGDAILVFDANRSGSVDDRTEFAFVAWKAGARTDLEGLSHFDTNGDGELSSADAGSGFDWEQFLIWKDANGDAVSQDGELVSLREAGIVSIGLDLKGNASELNGNIIHQTTTFRRTDGSEGTVGDVSFAVLRGSFAPGGSAGDVSTAKDVPQGDFPDESSKLIICNMPSSSYDLVLV
jgi:hypothetical protein